MRRSMLTVLGPAALGLVVYLWQVGRPALWLDEAATVNESRRPLGELLSFLAERDAVLGAYYLVMHPITAAGTVPPAEWAVRLPSVLAMTVAVALVADLARRWWGPQAALCAGILMALTPVMSRYAQEARPYAMAVAVAVLAVWLLQRASSRRASGWWWAGYAAAIALLGSMQLMALLTIVCHPFLLHDRMARRRFAVALAAGLSVPAWLATVAYRQRDRVSWIEPPTIVDLGEGVLEMVSGPGWAALLIGLALLGLLLPADAGRGHTVGLVVWFAVPPLVLAGLGQLTPLFVPRYLLVCTPALILLAAAALRRARWWWPAVAGVLALVIGFGHQSEIRRVDGHGPDLRAAAAVIAEGCSPPPAVREGVATLQALPYYLERVRCPVRWAVGTDTTGIDRLWVVRPDWVREPVDVNGFDRTRSVEVPGLDLTLWERAHPAPDE